VWGAAIALSLGLVAHLFRMIHRLGPAGPAKTGKDPAPQDNGAVLLSSWHQKFLSSMEELFLIFDADMRVRWANAAAAALIGLSPDELVGRDCSESGLFNWSKETGCPCIRALETGENQTIVVSTEEGQWWNLHAYPLFGPDGGKMGVSVIGIDITRQWETERALRLTQFTMDRAMPSIFWISPEGAFRYVNDAACRELGYTRAELTRMGVADIDPFHPENERRERLAMYGKTGGAVIESIHVTKDGRQIPVEIHIFYLEHEGEEYVVAIATDITERIKVMEELHAAKDMAERYFRIAGVMLLVIGPDETVIDINQCGCDILRCPREEIIGANWYDRFLPAEEREFFRSSFRQLVNDPTFQFYTIFPEGTEQRIMTATGEYRNIMWHNAVICDEDGRFVSTLSSGEDITEHIEVLRALEQSEARNRAIVGALPDLILRIDRQGVVLDYSTSDSSLLLVQPEQFLGRSVKQVGIPEHIRVSFLALLASALETQTVAQREFQMELAEGRRFFEIRVSPSGYEEVVVIMRDITERKQGEMELAESLREKDALLREIHHRVKNNLQVVMGLLNMQGRESDDSRLQSIIEQSRMRIRAIMLIHEKLYNTASFSRVSFQGYMRELTRMLHGFHKESAAAVTIEVTGDEVMMGIDQAMPCALIVNELVTNALKYAFSGKGGAINVSISRTGGNFELTVCDNGVGFDASALAEDKGLGHKLVDILARQLDGEARFERSNGARWIIRFPISGEST